MSAASFVAFAAGTCRSVSPCRISVAAFTCFAAGAGSYDIQNFSAGANCRSGASATRVSASTESRCACVIFGLWSATHLFCSRMMSIILSAGPAMIAIARSFGSVAATIGAIIPPSL